MEEYEQSLHRLWRVGNIENDPSCRIPFLKSFAYCKPL